MLRVFAYGIASGVFGNSQLHRCPAAPRTATVGSGYGSCISSTSASRQRWLRRQPPAPPEPTSPGLASLFICECRRWELSLPWRKQDTAYQRLSKQPGGAKGCPSGHPPQTGFRPLSFSFVTEAPCLPRMVVPMTDLEQPAEPVVVRLPAEIDLANAERVGEQLCSAITRGAAVVIADLTSTAFCDSAGVRQFVLAHNYADACDAQMRFVIPDRNVLRVFTLTGLDQLLSIYLSLGVAVSAGPELAGDAASG